MENNPIDIGDGRTAVRGRVADLPDAVPGEWTVDELRWRSETGVDWGHPDLDLDWKESPTEVLAEVTRALSSRGLKFVRFLDDCDAYFFKLVEARP